LTIAQNVLKYGTGALNIDACRYAYGDPCWIGNTEKHKGYPNGAGGWAYKFDPSFGSNRKINTNTDPYFLSEKGRWPANLYHCPKPSRGEREAGLEHLKTRPARSNMCLGDGQGERFDGKESAEVANFHPTVKPIKLMRWLCRLIGGKKGSVILDTFCGSGTTGCSAILEGYDFIGIEITPDYLPIIRGRLDWAKEEYMRENAQLSLFEDAI
jgi:DNA modification methylase